MRLNPPSAMTSLRETFSSILRIALDYSSREAILRAACWMLSSLEISEREFARRLGQVTHSDAPLAPDVDLLIRTGGDHRLSDFMLWESRIR